MTEHTHFVWLLQEEWLTADNGQCVGVQLQVQPQVLAATVRMEYGRETGLGQLAWDSSYKALRSQLGLEGSQ